MCAVSVRWRPGLHGAATPERGFGSKPEFRGVLAGKSAFWQERGARKRSPRPTGRGLFLSGAVLPCRSMLPVFHGPAWRARLPHPPACGVTVAGRRGAPPGATSLSSRFFRHLCAAGSNREICISDKRGVLQPCFEEPTRARNVHNGSPRQAVALWPWGGIVARSAFPFQVYTYQGSNLTANWHITL